MRPDLFSIGSFTVHGYGLCIAIGVIAAYLMSSYRARLAGYNEDMITSILLCFLGGGFIGSKLLYALTQMIRGELNFRTIFDLNNGYVVYGFLLGGILAMDILCRVKKADILAYLDLIMPAAALAQGFGRIGCFLAGCCYGLETESALGVMFPHNSIAPSGVKLFPIQLVFSLLNFILFGILMMISNKKRVFRMEIRRGEITVLYFLLYSIGRFILEYFRGDAERGRIGIFSTSQIISLCVFAVSGALLIMLQSKAVKGQIRKSDAMIDKKQNKV